MVRFGKVKTSVYCVTFLSCVLMIYFLAQPAVHILSKTLWSVSNHWHSKSLRSERLFESTGSPNAVFYRPRFKFLKEPTNVLKKICDEHHCPGYKNASWTIVNFIKSAAGNFMRRELLRRTWGGLSYVEGGRFSTVFLMGRADGNTSELLTEEQERYGDILQFDGPDDYKNMPLKTLSGMQWAADHLPNDSLYSSGDDDFMLNLGTLQEVVDESRRIVTEKKWPDFPLICTYKTKVSAKPFRPLKNGKFRKWAVGKAEYKWPYYPKFCLGGFYTTSVSIATQLLKVSRTTHELSVDDVWITGILREKLGIPWEMVISPQKKIAYHFTGYRDKGSDHNADFMKYEWKKIFRLFRLKNMCSC